MIFKGVLAMESAFNLKRKKKKKKIENLLTMIGAFLTQTRQYEISLWLLVRVCLVRFTEQIFWLEKCSYMIEFTSLCHFKLFK